MCNFFHLKNTTCLYVCLFCLVDIINKSITEFCCSVQHLNGQMLDYYTFWKNTNGSPSVVQFQISPLGKPFIFSCGSPKSGQWGFFRTRFSPLKKCFSAKHGLQLHPSSGLNNREQSGRVPPWLPDRVILTSTTYTQIHTYTHITDKGSQGVQ